jgi:predicted nucleic acid-binding protein
MSAPSERLLLDTSAWAQYLRARGSADLKRAVQQALDQGQVASCWVVKSELLIGARDAAAFTTLLEVLAAVSDLPITDESWVRAARLGFELRKQGFLVALPDLLIAQCAIDAACILWHVDTDFEHIKRQSDLHTRYWPPPG